MNYFILLLITLITLRSVVNESACTSLVFCQGDLLRVVQSAGLFKDSKTFVDMGLVGSSESTLRHFETMMAKTKNNPTKDDILQFIQANFQTTHGELEMWYPPDHQVNPPFLRKIKDAKYRALAKTVVDIWPNLGRRIRPEVLSHASRYSIIPVPNGFIIPGGRFREFYYWDSYWIIKGLLISGMKYTARGMVDNLFKIIDIYGFIPNGGRIYYLDRSQPPMLTMMVYEVNSKLPDVLWLKKSLKYLEKELNFWLKRKTIHVERNGKQYVLARYRSESDTPRPESYKEDVETAAKYPTDYLKRNTYSSIRTGAETGWDFSARWFFDTTGGNRGDLSMLNPSRVVPVDLNAFLHQSFKIMVQFYSKFKNKERAQFWSGKADEWLNGIEAVLYSNTNGIWFDFDIETQRARKYFYPSNFAPLWTQSYNVSDRQSYGKAATDYLLQNGIMDFQGGVPTSLMESGQQWDAPNAWAPLQGIVIFGLEMTEQPDAIRVAREFANRWLNSVVKVSDETREFFEKYNAVFYGTFGGGGEYEVQTGFGWTNGVVLELLDFYFIQKKLENIDPSAIVPSEAAEENKPPPS